MTNIDVFKILSYGVIGLGFLLALLSYRLLSKEQGREAPRVEMLRAINMYMAFSIILCVVGVVAQFIDRKTEKAEEGSRSSTGASQSPPKSLAENNASSPSVINEDDKWIVVIELDKTLEDAQGNSAKAIQAGYKTVTYKREGEFRNAIPFDSQHDAQNALTEIQAKVNATSFPARLGNFCPKRQPANGYIECVK